MVWAKKSTRVIEGMKVRNLPDQALLRELLNYDPLTGDLKWLHRDRSRFNDDRLCYAFNLTYAGRPALSCITRGYRVGNLLGTVCRAHRVIWKLMTGEEPDFIDHINGDRADNRWINLRSTDRVTNQRNMALSARNRSGRIGVSKCGDKWRAEIGAGGRTQSLGCYAKFEEAVAARCEAELRLGYHRNHGALIRKQLGSQAR